MMGQWQFDQAALFCEFLPEGILDGAGPDHPTPQGAFGRAICSVACSRAFSSKQGCESIRRGLGGMLKN
jgi:hypothetical protein